MIRDFTEITRGPKKFMTIDQNLEYNNEENNLQVFHILIESSPRR